MAGEGVSPRGGRVAVVTGGGRGLGRGIAIALADAGHDLVIGWNRDAVSAAETADAVRSRGREVELVFGDVAEHQTPKVLVEAAVTGLGGLDVWVNNAGVSMIAPVLETPASEMERMLSVNVIGTLHGMQAAARTMLERRTGGRIINLASDAGLQGFPNLGGYAATKFAVVALTQTAALELARQGITVNAVCPGTAETAMNHAEWKAERSLTGLSTDEVRQSYLAQIPAGRFCTPADVGAAVAYLAGPGADFVTGQSICVNGGTVLH
jgi:meso-butanediol dehydrogenase/(S,S)-butanediol dehydrogenase/diacetyl reductase